MTAQPSSWEGPQVISLLFRERAGRAVSEPERKGKGRCSWPFALSDVNRLGLAVPVGMAHLCSGLTFAHCDLG